MRDKQELKVVNLLAAISLVLSLVGCAGGPAYMPMREVNPIFIRFYTHQNIEELEQAYYASCRKDAKKQEDEQKGEKLMEECQAYLEHNTVMAFAKPPRPWTNDLWCELHMILNEWQIMQHEIKHCLYGFWHESDLDYIPKAIKIGD